MSSVDPISFKRCSHISMGVLILLIIEIFMSILSNRCASLQVDLIISTFLRSILSFSQRCLFHPYQVVFVFPPSHPFLQGLRFLNQVSIYSCEVSSLFSIIVLIRWISLVKMLTSFKFIILRLFSSPVDLPQAFCVDHILFPRSNAIPCRCLS